MFFKAKTGGYMASVCYGWKWVEDPIRRCDRLGLVREYVCDSESDILGLPGVPDILPGSTAIVQETGNAYMLYPTTGWKRV